MKLAELDTPFEKVRIIEYKTDGNTVVRNWYNLQHIIGPYYKDKTIVNEQGISSFNLYLKYEEGKDGIIHARDLKYIDRFTVELFEDKLKKMNIETPEGYIGLVNRWAQNRQFIGKAEIEFIRQFDEVSADQFAEYRERYYREKEIREREEAADRILKEEKAAQEDRQQRDQELAGYRKILMGWGDSMTPIRIHRVMAILGSLIQNDGKIMTRHEFVKKFLKDGWMPYKKENETHWYGSRWNPKQTKPRAEYQLRKDNVSYKVTKTEYDFAVYLVNNNKIQ